MENFYTSSRIIFLSKKKKKKMIASEKNYKVALMGPSSVGKTSIVVRLSKNSFSEDSQPTIGAAFVLREIITEKGTIVLSIWDTAGQERFKSLVPKYARGSYAIIVVFDMTDKSTLNQAQNIIETERDNYESYVLWYLVGNKQDGNISVSLEEVQQYCKQNDLIYFETSAKTGYNVKELFDDIAIKLINISLTTAKQNEAELLLKKEKSDCC